MGGGVYIGDNSWIIVEDIQCRIGQGACIRIEEGKNNVVRNIQSKWHQRGILVRGGSENTIEDCIVEENKDGIYLMGGASNNIVRRCKVFRNGNAPVWTENDRAGIAIGNYEVNPGNKIIGNEVAFNGGLRSDPGLIVYQAPYSVIRDNYVHDNYGSGVFVTISSDNTIVKNNRIINNGEEGVKADQQNISGLSVRRSRNVLVENNVIISNHVSEDTWVQDGKVDKGPRGGLDLRGNRGDDMRGIRFMNNIVCKTQNGPDIFVSEVPDTKGFMLKHPADMQAKCIEN
jgi:parallel beta-helix repeat protein